MKRNVYLKMKDLPQARRLFLGAFDLAGRLGSEEIRVEEALGRVTAGPVWAKESSPRHHLAAMDGIALKAERTFGARPDRPVHLTRGLDYEPVNTGQVLPQSFDTVVMIEQVIPSEQGPDEEGRERVFLEGPAFPWQHVRKLGEDLVATELILPAGSKLGPYQLGALVAGGVYQVQVVKRPKVAIIPTGAELIDLDQARQRPVEVGQLPEFNSLILAGLVEEAGGEAVRFRPIPDDYQLIKQTLTRAVEDGCDLVVINAGSSAGTSDFTASAVAELGEVLVHGVNIMPGKPTVLGKVGQTPVMGNPGYPVSAVISFEQLGGPLLAKMQGTPFLSRPSVEVKPVAPLPSKLGQEEFIRLKLGRVGSEMVAVPLHRGAGSISSLTRADGVIRIPALTEGVEADRPVRAELLRPLEEIEGNIVAIGSHDNTLDVLADLLRRREARFYLSSGNVGSLGGLKALARNQAHLAGSHLLDPETGQYNVTYIQRLLKGVSLKVVRLVLREQGFMVLAGNPKGIKGLADLVREEVTFINRQAGSGTRVLLDHHLKEAGLNPEGIKGYDQEEYTHMTVAAAVVSGRADVGLGILAAARALKLDFVPLVQEDYQLVIPQEHYRTAKVQTLLEVIGSRRFRETVRAMGGYSLDGSGRITYEQ
ncbi:MAG: molybdopterin biosynthesis protein [Deltaproteobacteria bacterium]|nr:molybdopterin biosynthesis protein [Deltaproteobacteria bacterium]